MDQQNNPDLSSDSDALRGVDLRSQLSLELFNGGSVPNDLHRLWFAQEHDDTDLLDSFELILMLGLGTEDALAPIEADAGSDPAALGALRRLLDEVTFVAEAMDGVLLGYWSPEVAAGTTAGTAAGTGGGMQERVEPVVVAIDDHGQLSVLGRSIAEALISLTDADDPGEAAEVVTELRALGIDPMAVTVGEVLARIEAIPEPNEVVLGYLLAERLNS